MHIVCHAKQSFRNIKVMWERFVRLFDICYASTERKMFETKIYTGLQELKKSPSAR